jgi:hypothetical protein
VWLSEEEHRGRRCNGHGPSKPPPARHPFTSSLL